MTTPSALRPPGAPSSVYAGILCCSVGVLMQEILLTRIFSFTIWYHLAYLTISTALLGFGAAALTALPGTFLWRWLRLPPSPRRSGWERGWSCVRFTTRC